MAVIGKDVLNVNSELNMINSEVLEKMKEQYEKAKALAKEAWHEGDHEGNNNDYYYFECGFVAGLNYQRYKAPENLAN